MANESITIYKLIILYTLSKVDVPLPPGFIFDYAIGHNYTNYFNMQNALAELLQAEFIEEDATYQRSYYKLTDAGIETLEFFGTQLSVDIRREIDEYLKENRYEIVNDTSMMSDYKLTARGTYLASCSLREGKHTIFHLDLEVTTEEDAMKVCENWRKQSETLYQTAIKNLL